MVLSSLFGNRREMVFRCAPFFICCVLEESEEKMSDSAVQSTPDEYEDDFEKDLDWLISEESKSEEQVGEWICNDSRNRFISLRQSAGVWYSITQTLYPCVWNQPHWHRSIHTFTHPENYVSRHCIIQHIRSMYLIQPLENMLSFIQKLQLCFIYKPSNFYECLSSAEHKRRYFKESG